MSPLRDGFGQSLFLSGVLAPKVGYAEREDPTTNCVQIFIKYLIPEESNFKIEKASALRSLEWSEEILLILAVSSFLASGDNGHLHQVRKAVVVNVETTQLKCCDQLHIAIEGDD
jgi:hypothetical protein